MHNSFSLRVDTWLLGRTRQSNTLVLHHCWHLLMGQSSLRDEIVLWVWQNSEIYWNAERGYTRYKYLLVAGTMLSSSGSMWTESLEFKPGSDYFVYVFPVMLMCSPDERHFHSRRARSYVLVSHIPAWESARTFWDCWTEEKRTGKAGSALWALGGEVNSFRKCLWSMH